MPTCSARAGQSRHLIPQLPCGLFKPGLLSRREPGFPRTLRYLFPRRVQSHNVEMEWRLWGGISTGSGRELNMIPSFPVELRGVIGDEAMA
jgi:hypothetical protein